MKAGAKIAAKVGGKLAAKAGGKLAAKAGGKIAAKASGKIGAKLGAKVTKGFSKVEKLTGGKLGNAAELKKKAGNQLKQTALQGGQKIAGNKQQKQAQQDADTNRLVEANAEAARSNASSSSGGYSSPSGASMDGASNYVVKPGGSIPKQVMREPGTDLKNSLSESNIITQQNRQFLPEELDVKGFSVPVAGIARVTGAMIKTKQEKNSNKLTAATPRTSGAGNISSGSKTPSLRIPSGSKTPSLRIPLNKKDLKQTAVLNSNKLLRQRQSTADKESKFSKVAKNVAGMDRKKQLTQGIKPSYKK